MNEEGRSPDRAWRRGKRSTTADPVSPKETLVITHPALRRIKPRL